MWNRDRFVGGDMVIVDDIQYRPRYSRVLVHRYKVHAVVEIFHSPVLVEVVLDDGHRIKVSIRALILHPHSRIHHAVSGDRYMKKIGKPGA